MVFAALIANDETLRADASSTSRLIFIGTRFGAREARQWPLSWRKTTPGGVRSSSSEIGHVGQGGRRGRAGITRKRVEEVGVASPVEPSRLMNQAVWSAF